MLARIAHDVYWLGRHLVRAEHTARMLDGLFHADLQGRPDDPTSVTLTWDSLLTIMGAGSRSRPASSAARRGDRRLTLDPKNPVSIRACVERAPRGGPHGAGYHLGGDVGVGEHLQPGHEGATWIRACARAPTRSTRTSRSARRCSGA